jgi:hypothetical protein
VSTEPNPYREVRIDVIDMAHCSSCHGYRSQPTAFLLDRMSGAYTWLCRDCTRVLLRAAQMAMLTHRYVEVED